MPEATFDQLWRGTTSVSGLTAALFTAAAFMFASGIASAMHTVPPIVTATYYVSTILMVTLLWAHGLQTVRRQ